MQRFFCSFLTASQWKYLFRASWLLKQIMYVSRMGIYVHAFVYIFVIAYENPYWKTQNMVRMSTYKRARADGRIQAGTDLRQVSLTAYKYWRKKLCSVICVQWDLPVANVFRFVSFRRLGRILQHTFSPTFVFFREEFHKQWRKCKHTCENACPCAERTHNALVVDMP